MCDMCQSAIIRGLPEIGFSEHFDLHPGEPCRDWFRPEPWWEEIQHCRAQFADNLVIRAGIEVGEPHLFTEATAQMLARLPFDYVIGSLHWVGRDSVFDINYFKTRDADLAYGAFFVELERMTRVGGFDILGHFDVPIRTAHAVYGSYAPADFEDLIRPVLRNCIRNGIALDLNTSALRSRVKVLTPNLDILRWYVELGGERVTLGSDAHKPGDVGSHLDIAISTARAAGIQYLTYFEQRQAKLLPLP
jgi:histidinol-phosphatase (PHP family)